jgi:hypothetical protein
MDMSELIERTKQNIWQAISDYGKHTDQTSVMDDCTANFVNQLASDSCYAKQELRELFSKSPVWDANLDALVINGTRTHDPDPDRICALGTDILSEAIYRADNSRPIYDAIRFFYDPNFEQEGIAAIKQLAPKAYAPNKKKSRVFKALCQALGVADETAGSDFQRLYAQFADELTSKKIGFKLYVSINPAHFITMSNPKGDHRGTTLTSCHSFNSTEYEYNNGCTGYARDKVSFIAFTVADPADKETLNNRKTTRQVFAYKPGNGLLLQSRMYNTSGGVYGASEDSKLYRDLIQREISMLENVPNLWKTYPTVGEKSFCVERGDGFGGYPDWEYENFDGKVSIRADHEEDFRSLVVGSYGLCVSCGCETSYGVYCEDCKDGRGGGYYCECCEEYVDEELYSVRDSRGNWIEVCEDCRDENFTYCECCGEYWPNDCTTEIDDRYYCDSCRNEYCSECYECDDYHHTDNMTEVVNARGDEVLVCEDCRDRYYEQCEVCGEYHIREDMTFVTLRDGDHAYVCEDCMDSYEVCPHCGTMIERCDNGTCPECGAVIDEKEEDEAV